MAGPKAQTPAPIDRPLSRAYLRQFTGWATAYPPGLSDPASLRQMENVMITRDGAARVRPGLRYLSYSVPPDQDPELPLGAPIDQPVVGSHEVFYLNDGSKAYLFAVREDDLSVGFRVLRFDNLTTTVHGLTEPGIDFDVPQTEAVLAFSAGTTYVKYLQIDNKIWALSDNGETMRLFTVGDTKTAKRISSLERPDWNVADKLTIVQPPRTWITSGTPTGVRNNLSTNPKAKASTADWNANVISTDPIKLTRQVGGSAPYGGTYFRSESMELRRNLVPYPLHNTADGSEAGWVANYYCNTVTATSAGLGILSDAAPGVGAFFNALGPGINNIEAGKSYVIAFDLVSSVRISSWRTIIRWYTAANAQIGSDVWNTSSSLSAGRKVTVPVTAPAGAVWCRIYFGGLKTTDNLASSLTIKNVLMCKNGESTAMFHGGSGANYFWEGTAGASQSVYHPPQTVAPGHLMYSGITAGLQYSASAYVQGSVARTAKMNLIFVDGQGQQVGAAVVGAGVVENTGDWVKRISATGTAPAGASRMWAIITYDVDIPRGEYHRFTGLLVEQSGSVGAYFDGDTTNTSTLKYAWTENINGKPDTPGTAKSRETTYATGVAVPGAAVPTDNSLISDGDPNKNEYNVGFFYTLSNEVGESAPSQVSTIKVQRGWAAWLWQKPKAGSDEPDSAQPTNDPILCADQLVAIMPQEVFDAAKDQGAIAWNLYMMTWSDQDVVPTTAVKVDVREIHPDTAYGSAGWGRMTPQLADLTADNAAVPTLKTRFNYSVPSSGGQGVVASDRMVMVFDPARAAVIKWSSNRQGDYSNFTAARGGGYKTLTSGNLNVPAAVKLWQNPQSVDTLCILCLGSDGRSSSYYMAPAQVASQSEATNIMGFEETTATPGTTSPYGVEVFNNALYHPLDTEIMKSTASNYNINHLSITDNIANMWRQLQLKQKIVSSQHNNRLYYVVYNPLGEPLQDDCRGNEIWVFDGAQKAGSWSRFLIQASSLREIEQGGRTYMSVVRPDGIYYLDPNYPFDDKVINGELVLRPIPWLIETNTQGANRAHDAWCHFRQAGLTLGNFDGRIQWGIRGVDRHGKPVFVTKEAANKFGEPFEWAPTDQDDFLQINRDMQQWTFLAGSLYDENGDVVFSRGQINFVQYRYAPISVNVGYEYGSVETFEYGRSRDSALEQLTSAGVPDPTPYTNRLSGFPLA